MGDIFARSAEEESFSMGEKFQMSNGMQYLMRKTHHEIMEAFEKMDEVFGAKPSEMHKAYRTIKIGQVLHEMVGEPDELSQDGMVLFVSPVIRKVLEEFPIV